MLGIPFSAAHHRCHIETEHPMTTKTAYFRLERRAKSTVLYLSREGGKGAIRLPHEVTREQIRDLIGDVPSGEHGRRQIVMDRLRGAGLVK